MTRKRTTFKQSALILLISVITASNAALFDRCDHTYNINPGYSYLESPYYPDYYPSNTSCRYKFIAPLDYEIHMNCTIDLKKNPNSCSTEYFYVSTDGDSQLRGSEKFCGVGTISRKSVFRTLVLAYTSDGSNGRFHCQLYAAPQPFDCGWSANTKILNGFVAGINEYPSVVALRDVTSPLNVYCAGSIVSHRYILTAAHCARQQTNPENILAIVGEHDTQSSSESPYTQTYGIQQIIEHPNYSTNPINNDIALLRTKQDIEWSRGVGPICLPRSSSNSFTNKDVDVMGWGTTSFGGPTSSVLLKTNLKVADNADCARAYQNMAPITSSHLCTYDNLGQSRDSCQYDSGGPVIYRGQRQRLVGSVSFGKICGEGGYAMGVNTRTTSYLDWIRSHIGAPQSVASPNAGTRSVSTKNFGTQNVPKQTSSRKSSSSSFSSRTIKGIVALI